MTSIENARNIVSRNPHFYSKKVIVHDTSVELFDYRLANYKDFAENDAWDLRGLAFVNTQRFPALPKFFNVNQTTGWMLKDLTSPVVDVLEKLDGSLITFIRIGDRIIAKSKMSFESEQAKAAQNVYESDSRYQTFVTQQLDLGNTPIFEWVSPTNQIVVDYPTDRLVLLQIRTPTGWADPTGYDIPTATRFHYSLDELMNLRETVKDIEGWVVRFEDGKLAKIKTMWYCERHAIIHDLREDRIVKSILDGTIDDLVSWLNSESRKPVNAIIEKVSKYHAEKSLELNYLKSVLLEIGKKEFALQHRSNPLFSTVVRNKMINDFIGDKTKTLGATKMFLKTLDK